MRFQIGPIWFELSPGLVDDALSTASRSAPEPLRRQYLEEREAIATIEIVDIREESFRDLDARWMERFGVMEALRSVLDEKHPLTRGVTGCRLEKARLPVEEEIRLETKEGSLSVLAISLRGETLVSAERLRNLLETAT